MADPLAAVIIQPVHQVAVTGETLQFFLQYTLTEGSPQEFVGIQKQDVIIRGQGGGGIFLGAIAGKRLAVELATHFFHQLSRAVGRKRIQYDDLIRYFTDRINAPSDVFFFIKSNNYDR